MEDEDEVKDDVHSDDEDEGDEDSDEGSEDEEGDEDSEEEEEGDEENEDKEFAFMKKKMKKKSKKEWSEVMSDLEEVLEAIEDEEALTEVKKGLEMMKKGMEKGCSRQMMGKKCGKYMNEGKKAHKADCDCFVCKKKKDHDEEDKEDGDDEGLTDAQKKLPEALRKAIAKKGKGKKGEGKKCGKNMNEEEASWWKSVNEMLGSDPNQKNWDGGWSEVGEVEQAVREGEQLDEVLGLDTPDYSGKPGVMSRIVQSPLNAFKRVSGVQSHTLKAYMKSAHEKAVEVALARVLGKKQEADELEKELRSTYTDHPDAEDHVGSQHTLSNDIWAKTEHIKEYMKQGMSPYEAAQKVAKSVAMFSR
jgi:hypothetical protein